MLAYICLPARSGSATYKSISPGVRADLNCAHAAPEPAITVFCFGCVSIHFSTISPRPFNAFTTLKSRGRSIGDPAYLRRRVTSIPASNLIAFSGVSPFGVGNFPSNARNLGVPGNLGISGTFTASIIAGIFTFAFNARTLGISGTFTASIIAGIFTFAFTTSETLAPFVSACSPTSSPMVAPGSVVNPRNIDCPIIYIPTVVAAGNISGLRAMVTAAPGNMPAISTPAAGARNATPYPTPFTCPPSHRIGSGIAFL